MEYKNFVLDDFQVEALGAVDRWNTVIVCAPTGSGKTLIAEYIIDKCMREGYEVIYTAPIKALSNQKYRDFKEQYGDRVGIITGDVVINPSAACLIMTTEIFRNIIYDDPQRLNQVRYVVFDEIHYLEDPRRGTVWEESIMLAPQHIHFLCLSATIANVEELASWMKSIRQSEVSIVFHDQRPVPLEPFVYIEGGNQPFQMQQLSRALSYANTIAAKNRQMEKEGQQFDRRRQGLPIFEYLRNKGLLPALCFSFSRKNCEKLAFHFRYMNLLSREDSQKAVAIFDEHVERCNLASYVSTGNLRKLVEFGTAYHHAGMLPSQKEIVEILFSKNLIKLLFATETFAVGINMPAKTVVFDGLEKNDGVSFRYLRAYEYQQMSGRAGRRGIDEKGFVYALIDPKFYNYAETKRTLLGRIEPIKSQFAFSYSSILNLYSNRSRDQISELCEKSFSYYQMKSVIEEKTRGLAELEEKLSHIECALPNPRKTIMSFVETRASIDSFKSRLVEIKRMIRKTRPEESGELKREMRKVQSDIHFGFKNLKRMKCSHCYYQTGCLAAAEGYFASKRQLHELTNYLGFDLDGKFAFLERIGYLKGDKLLPRGEFASQIFGYEIHATEFYFDGYIQKLTPDEINAMICGIVFENKTRAPYTIKDKNLKHLLREFRVKIDRIVSTEVDFCKIGTIKTMENAMAEAAYRWSAGATFRELVESQNLLLEGDLIRLFRNCVDLLRQIRRALAQDKFNQAKIEECLTRMNRDIVDAEQFM